MLRGHVFQYEGTRQSEWFVLLHEKEQSHREHSQPGKQDHVIVDMEAKQIML